MNAMVPLIALILIFWTMMWGAAQLKRLSESCPPGPPRSPEYIRWLSDETEPDEDWYNDWIEWAKANVKQPSSNKTAKY